MIQVITANTRHSIQKGAVLALRRRRKIHWKRTIVGWRDGLHDLGFCVPRTSLPRTLLYSLLALGLMFAVFVPYVHVVRALGWFPEQPPASMDLPALMVWMTLGVVVVPIVEEAIFRGLFLRMLTQGFQVGSLFVVFCGGRTVLAFTRMQMVGYGNGVLGVWLPVMLQGAIFGSGHNLEVMVAMSIAGMLLGWLRVVSGSLWPCVAVHVAWNAFALFDAFTRVLT